MSKKQKLKLLKEFIKGWSHFCDCINWSDSHLDGDSIVFMNEMPGKIVTALKD